MKRTIALILILSQLLLLAACSETPVEESQEETSGSVQNTADTTESESVEEEPMPDLPARNFEGDNFVFITRSYTGQHSAADIMDIWAEGETGEGLNDAVFQRNMWMADTYNVVIEEVKTSNAPNMITTSVAAMDGAYDISYIKANDAQTLAKSGNFLNYKTLDYIDLKAPWWDNNAAEELEIAGKLFLGVNDIMLANNNATSAVVFNKQMLIDHGYTENMYDLVKENKWSLDKVSEMAERVLNDVDGNGIYDENDIYGYMCYRDAAMSMFHSSGGRIATKNTDGNLELTVGQEFFYDAFYASLLLMTQKYTFNIHKEMEAKYSSTYYQIAEEMFRQDQALFYWILVHDIQKFRDMESDFGILPVPSYDPEISGYGSTVNQYHGCMMSILTTADPDQAAYILEVMAAKSRYTVQEEYYNICLTRKYSRDEDSAEMLDIIFDNRIYDVGAYYNIGEFTATINSLTMKNITDVASVIKRKDKSARRQIEELVADYSAIESIE